VASRVEELDLPQLDLLDAKTRAERLELLRAVQADGHWLVRTPTGYLVTRYEDAVAILRDRRFHQFASRLAEFAGIDDPAFLARRRTSLLTAEGDVHARLRRLVAPAFTPRAADRLRPYMRQVINDLVDPVAPTGRCELVADVAEHYPVPIICRLLGAPEEDWKLFSRWAADLLRVFNFNFPADLPVIMAAQDEMGTYVRELIERRRHDPHDDLLTDLIAVEEAGDRLAPEELESMAVAVLVGGTDTTRNQLGLTVALFTEHPDQWALLAERPELAGRAVEESMRLFGAIAGTARFASEDIEYRGVVFPKDCVVSTSFVAANIDPEVFPGAETFDLTRDAPAAAPPHLSFGSGMHFCLGAWLARAELQEALPVMARRMRDLRVDGTIAWKPNATGIWGPAELPLRFTPET
jgi:cytochrome P450